MGDVQNSPEKEVSPYGPWLLVSYGKQGNRNFKGKVGKGGVNSARGNNNSAVPTGNMNRNGAGGSTNFGYGGSNRYSSDGFNRKTEGEFSEVKNGRKDIMKNGRGNKSMDGTNSSVGDIPNGSRFDVLNDEVEATGIEDNLNSNLCYQEGNNSKGKVVLFEITNMNKKQIVKIGKGNKKTAKKVDRLGIKKNSIQGVASYFKGNLGAVGNSQDQQSSCTAKDSEGHDSASILCHFHKDVQAFKDRCGAMADDCLKQVNLSNHGRAITYEAEVWMANLEKEIQNHEHSMDLHQHVMPHLHQRNAQQDNHKPGLDQLDNHKPGLDHVDTV
ncbi:hypothetical protein LWI29_001800 [Acer saccharum]|uniref:Uncharacterized protein n=1 Tax=Acer saccharum TaxID=4024 RepID=A0AA39SQT3_ACESA|nr:hypothetical protein LWI29_001800 [Acer saccharum]